LDVFQRGPFHQTPVLSNAANFGSGFDRVGIGIFTTLSNDGSGPSTGSGIISSKRVTTSGGIVTKRDNGWSDKQWAFVLVVGFTLFALFIALILQLFIER
jgi:hypothetical protein